MKQPIRYFAIGLFTASLILFIASYLLEPETISEEKAIDELIENIEANGYRVISESEYITLSVNKKNETKSEPEEKKDEKKDTAEKEPEKVEEEEKEKEVDEEKEKELIKYTLTVKENMIPSTVTTLLVENKILDDPAEFNQYLEDEGYSQLIQVGKHKVTSDMSMKEIAEELMKFN